MAKLFYSIILIFLLVIPACNTSVKTNEASNSLSDNKENTGGGLTFTNKEFKEQAKPGCDSCPQVTVSVPIAAGNEAIARKINDAVFAAVQKVLGEDDKQFTSYDSLLANFMGMYKKMMAELPGMVIGWAGTVKGSVVKQTDSLVNIMLEAYTNTGGAHGNTNTFSLLFNPQAGNLLSVSDVIKNMPAFTEFAEKKFREAFTIPANAPINSTMFTFNNNKFALPQNIFFTKDSLLLHYNAYEIGPYVIGAKELKIPYSEIRDYLRVQP